MTGEAPAAVETEIAEIETTIRDDGHSYWRDPDMRRRYGELLEAREAGGAGRPRRPDAVGSEIAAIEKRMRDDFAAYRADPEMQARYGALLAARDGTGDDADGDAAQAGAEPPPDRQDAPNEMTEALGSAEALFDDLHVAGREATLAALSEGGAGDFEGNLRAMQMVAVDVAQDLDDPAAAEEFVASFARLPDRVQAGAFEALLQDGSGLPAAGEAALDTFRAEDDAAETLLAEWGGGAAERLGVARARLATMTAGLNGAERERFEHFVASAPVEEWTAFLRHLADPTPAQDRPGFRALRGAAA